ncbi:hypothetical protein BDA99DRAFT_535773 [Phascolomyces articulosus]|uniref:Uncharacterized protein n=1 Tax=Phascolomyces articulosus TaxID=60185 RepID=A0AAD5K415_9FUNG|nr:hypothetical protein BDA99DRAFT_535773 [Phascolomyces articulosus]
MPCDLKLIVVYMIIKVASDILIVNDVGDAVSQWLDQFFKHNRNHYAQNHVDPVDIDMPELRLVTLQHPISNRYVKKKMNGLQQDINKIGEVTFFIIRLYIPGIDQNTGIKDGWNVMDHLKITRNIPGVPGHDNGCFSVDTLPLTSGIVQVGYPIQVLERIPASFVEHPFPPGSTHT